MCYFLTVIKEQTGNPEKQLFPVLFYFWKKIFAERESN